MITDLEAREISLMPTRTNVRAVADEANDATQTAANVSKEAAQMGTEAARRATRDLSGTNGAFAAGGQRNLTQNFEKFSKGFGGLAAFGQDNVEAVVKSSEIAAKAFEGIGQELTAYSKKSLEDGVAAAQDFASAKTVTELFEKQTAYTQTAFESWLNQANKMNEIFVAAAKDASAPIAQRVSAASDALKSISL